MPFVFEIHYEMNQTSEVLGASLDIKSIPCKKMEGQ